MGEPREFLMVAVCLQALYDTFMEGCLTSRLDDPNKRRRITQFRDECLDTFINIRYNYIDDLPTDRLLHIHPNYMIHKCRANVFGAVQMSLASLISHGQIEDATVAEVLSQFCIWHYERGVKEFYIRDEIDFLNDTLDIAIVAMGGELRSNPKQ